MTCHVSGLKETELLERRPGVSVGCAVCDGHRAQPPRTVTAVNYLEEDWQDGGSRDELDVYWKGLIWHRIALDRQILKQYADVFNTR